MAENFNKGVNRVWYRANRFATGKIVEVKFRKPNGISTDFIIVTESEITGMYYLDYNFDEYGQWLGIFYENGIKIASGVFHISPKIFNMFVTYNSKVNKG